MRRGPGAAGVCLGAVALLLAAADVRAFESVATIQKIDLEKNAIHVRIRGRNRIAALAKDVRVQRADGKPLPGGLQAKELKEGAEVTVAGSVKDGRRVIQVIRLGGRGRPLRSPGKRSVGLKPLTEMSAKARYKGEDGGLYGGGKNVPPPRHQKAARQELARIVPLDPDGKPAPDGKVVLISIGMSNTTQEFSRFKALADRDAHKRRHLVVVDGAQGGQDAQRWSRPQMPAWAALRQRHRRAGVTARQVQVAWIKHARMGPRRFGEYPKHAEELNGHVRKSLQIARREFPNLRVAHLSSRIYAGYATTPLNPEPYAYESALAVRRLILDQINGDAALNWDAAKGQVKAPLLLWGPYLWADGTTPRKSDGLVWKREDLAGDGTHPSATSGRDKVGRLLLRFCKTDANARSWFKGPPAAED